MDALDFSHNFFTCNNIMQLTKLPITSAVTLLKAVFLSLSHNQEEANEDILFEINGIFDPRDVTKNELIERMYLPAIG